MNLVAQAIQWIFGTDHNGADPIGAAIVTQLVFTFSSVLIAALIAVPLGWAIGHTGRGRDVAVAISGAARAIPSFGLLVLLVLLIGVTQKPLAAIITFVILGIPSILAGAYAGFEAIDRRVIDAGRAMGMTGWQVLWRIEVPLGLPLLVAGIRSAVLQVVATVTIGAVVGLGGLGQYILLGIPLRRFDIALAGALLVAVLALLLDAIFAILQHYSVPRGVRVRPTRTRRTPSSSTESARTPTASEAAA
jgi:osmoprotectant transport system permease protein